MIFSGALAGVFLYFLISVLKVGWMIWAYFVTVAVITHLFYKGKHFKTAKLNLFFLYAVSLLLWLKGFPYDDISNLVYLLGGASAIFSLSDKVWKTFLKFSAWILVAISISLMIYYRFNSWPISLAVAAIIIPIALRDKEQSEENKNRS